MRQSRWSLNHCSTEIRQAIVDELLGGLELPVRERIISAAEGNPLYVEQIVSMLLETGAIRREGDRWVADRPIERYRYPADR